MSDPKAAVLFPGQGAFSGAALKDVAAQYAADRRDAR